MAQFTASPGQPVDNQTFVSGDRLTVVSGGVAISDSFTQGADAVVSSGGILSASTVLSGGIIYNDGDVTDLVLSAGAVLSDTGQATRTSAFSGSLIELGGSAQGTVLNGGAVEVVFKGGGSPDITDTGATVASGGTILVSGTTEGTVLLAGGAEVVSATGSAVGTILSSGGLLVALPGATVQGTVAAGGSVVSTGVVLFQQDSGTVAEGATVTGDVLGPAEQQFVLSGGTAISAVLEGNLLNGTYALNTLSSYAAQIVYAGGIASNTAIGIEGDQIVSAGGVATNAVVFGGLQDITVSGSAGGTTVSGFGIVHVASGASLTDAVILANGHDEIDGTALRLTITSGGFGAVRSGGVVTSLTVQAGGDQTVDSGGTVSSLIVAGMAEIDGTATGVTIQAGGVISATGALADDVVMSGGSEALIFAGSSTNTVLLSGGLQRDEGLALNTIIQAGGTQAVEGGSAISAIVNSGGVQTISGGVATQTVVSAGGVVQVLGGGVANGTMLAGTLFAQGGPFDGTALTSSVDVLSGGAEIVSSGNEADGTIVESGGVLIVFSGGIVNGVVNSGGQVVSTGIVVEDASAHFTVYGATASGLVLGSGSTAFVLSDGRATDFTVQSGAALEIAGGTALGTIVNGGREDVSNGGAVSGGTVLAGGLVAIVSGGGAVDATVGSGGLFGVFDDGTATGTIVLSGGAEGVFSVSAGGGVTTDTVIHSGGVSLIAGGTTSGTILQGGAAQVLADGSASGTTIDSGGAFAVLGGVATAPILNSGGVIIPLLGGEIDAPVLAGGTIVSNGVVTYNLFAGTTVYTSGPVDNLALTSGGQTFVLQGGVVNAGVATGGFAYTADVQADGVEVGAVFNTNVVVLDGGLVNGLTVSSGATEDIAGGIGSGTIVSSGGTEYVDSGTAYGTIVEAGGSFVVSSGGSASGAVLSGGTAELVSGGTLSDVTFSAPGGVLQLDGPDGFATVIAGFAPGDTIYLPGVSIGGTSSSVQPDSNDVLTVGQYGTSVTLQFAGDFSGESFSLASDVTNGGTLVTVQAGAPCYCRGSLILTSRGEVPVEDLAIGDELITPSGARHPLRWIGQRSYDGRFIAGDHLMLPVTIRAGALADGVPHTDLHVSPGHAIWVDGQLVPAWRLVNGRSITQAEAVEQVTYFHLELHRHDVLLANGAPAESFLDATGFRGQFQNAADFAARYPDAAPLAPLQARLEDGFALQRIQERLADRAGLIGPVEPAGALRGYVDQAGPDRVCGWAQDSDSPEEPVILEISVGDVPVLTVLANAFRADLRKAGLGSGCCAFDMPLPTGFAGPIVVKRVTDGTVLGRSDAADRTPWAA